MRLIDADALLSKYNGNILTAQTDYAEGCRDIIEDICNAPTIDPVKHGHWKEQEDSWDDSTYYRCSCCGEDFYMWEGTTPKEIMFNFCPSCGAKMDEDATDINVGKR